MRLSLAQLETKAPSDGNAVDEDGPVLVDGRRIAEPLTDSLEVRLAVNLVLSQRRVRPADEDRKVATFLPGARTDGVARPTLDGEITGLKVEEQGGRCLQGPEQRCLTDAGLAEDAALDATPFGEALIGRDDGEAHQLPPCFLAMASRALSAPTAPFLRAMS